MSTAIEDLTTLSDINEEILLNHLYQRFLEDKIYTYIGDILISVNPYKSVSLYSHEFLSQQPLSSIAHIYSTACTVWNDMILFDNDQCCVISGESGAGKTEACKYLVRKLTELSPGHSVLEQRIIQVNPLLEAFGNAQTVMNNNSSRFGKYLQLKFNFKGEVNGAKINEYLLEKSRVVYQNPGERNFHVFYWILEGLDDVVKMRLQLDNYSEFRYLGGSPQLHGNEKNNYKQLKDCFDLVGFKEEEQESILVCLASILHLGNIIISVDKHEFAYIAQSCESLQRAAVLLGISESELTDLLTVTISLARTETIRKHLSKDKAEAARDALSKALYDRVFRWIVNQINHLLAPNIEDYYTSHDIGILDIFGFENFQQNSFEQLCINIANEQLHQFFIEHIFKIELEEYQEQDIQGVTFNIIDNQHLLDIFMFGSRSIFRLLDDQSSIPQANDVLFLQKLNNCLQKESFYEASKSITSGQFTIYHFAGKVTYKVEHFLEKNNDAIPTGIKQVLQSSNNDLVSLLFRASVTPTGTLSLQRRTTSRLSIKTRGKRGRGEFIKAPTISAQFKNSLAVLVNKMTTAKPHFIRCLKPNKSKSPDVFDHKYVSQQLHQTGMLATVQIRREGYAYRPTFHEFYSRFGGIVRKYRSDLSMEIICQLILRDTGISPEEYQIGKSKLFLKHWHSEQLEIVLQTRHRAAVSLQKIVRGFLQRKRYNHLLYIKTVHTQTLKRLLENVTTELEGVFKCIEQLNTFDEERALEEKRRSEALSGPLSIIPKLSPPSNLYYLPPPLLLSDDEESESRDESKEQMKKKSSQVKMEEKKFVSVDAKCQQQVRMLRSSVSASYTWLYGMITQKKAEDLLKEQVPGTYLVRINRKRLGHILSYRSDDNIGCHIIISQLPNSKYVLTGETVVHNSIEELVQYYTENVICSTGEVLKCPFIEDEEIVKVELNDKVTAFF